jgi:transposase
MKHKKKGSAVFKTYATNQLMILPPSLEDFIPSNHPARTVNEVIDRIDINPLLHKFPGGGASSYHPRLLLKVLVFSYLNNVYSSRKIETLVNESIPYMWLAGMTHPDHNTINRFRSDRLKGVLKPVFKQIVLLLAEAGMLDLKEIYVDGTKIEANSNRYTFVWGNSLKTNKERIKKQLDELWEYAQSLAEQELEDTRPTDYSQVNPEKVKQTIEQIDKALKDQPVKKKVRQKLNYAKKVWVSNLEKYQEHENILKGRKSFSKTDPDATFMRMKEDHMRNGQLKPGYNLQLSTNNQVITNYTIHANPTDTLTLIPHLEDYKQLYGNMPQTVIADAGYGSQQNYEYLEEQSIDHYVKYNTFDQQAKKGKQNPFDLHNLFYNSHRDCYYCPMGQPMRKVGQRRQLTRNGFIQTLDVYEAINCSACPIRGLCHKATGNRRIEANHRLNKLKEKARERLLSPKGVLHRKRRPIEVEPVFGNIKSNHGFKRFYLRGNQKVEIEVGLIAIAQNLRKMAS